MKMFHKDLLIAIRILPGLVLCFSLASGTSFAQDKTSDSVWQKEDTTKLSDKQVKYLLSKCLEQLFRATSQIREEGLPALGHFIDNDYVEDIYLTFDVGFDTVILSEYEKYNYVDFSHKQNINQIIKSFQPTFKIPLRYLENGSNVLMNTIFLDHMGHVSISDLYLHRDMITVLFKIYMKSAETPEAFYDSPITVRFYAKRCSTGEIFVLSTDNTHTLMPIFYKGVHVLKSYNLSPNYRCPFYGPRIHENSFKRIVDE